MTKNKSFFFLYIGCSLNLFDGFDNVNSFVLFNVFFFFKNYYTNALKLYDKKW